MPDRRFYSVHKAGDAKRRRLSLAAILLALSLLLVPLAVSAETVLPDEAVTEPADDLTEPGEEAATAETSEGEATDPGESDPEESATEQDESGESTDDSTDPTDEPTDPSDDPTEPTVVPTDPETGEPLPTDPETGEPIETDGPGMKLTRTGARLIGTVIDNWTNMRNLPTSVNSVIVTTLMKGARVEVLGEVDSQGDTANPKWYEVETGDKKRGYIASTLLTVTEESDDITPVSPIVITDIEAWLNEQGFPESYKPALRELHAKYPRWIFTSLFPRMADGSVVGWDYALSQQSRVGVNLVPLSNSPAFKSYDPKAYNYRTDSWYSLDAGWTGASQEAVAYFLDPRNFLDEQSIFMFENLGYNAQLHSIEGVRQALAGTFMDGTEKQPGVDENGRQVAYDHAEMFMKAAAYSQASPYFLAHRSIYEVGPWGSGSVSGSYTSSKYPDEDFTGIYNYYNIGASADPYDPVGNGLYYAKYGTTPAYLLPWTDRYRAIVGGAHWISEGYVGAGQATSYLQKFDLDYDSYFGAFWHQYMQNLRGPLGESSRVYNTYRDRGVLSTTGFEFVIPVMSGMPAAASPYPSDDRSRNNYLKSLTVTNGTLSPAFSPDVTSYSVNIADNVDASVVAASAFHSRAVVGRAGRYEIPPGGLTVSVTVTSERGDLRVYEIKFNKSGTAPTPSPTPQPTAAPTTPPTASGPNPTSSIYSMKDGYIGGFEIAERQNTVEILTANLSFASGYRLEIKNGAGRVLTSGLIGTGATLSFIDGAGNVRQTLTVLIYGDVNGDGRSDTTDINMIYDHRLGRDVRTGIQVLAMDTNGDGRQNTVDMNAIYDQRLGRSKFSQALR